MKRIYSLFIKSSNIRYGCLIRWRYSVGCGFLCCFFFIFLRYSINSTPNLRSTNTSISRSQPLSIFFPLPPVFSSPGINPSGNRVSPYEGIINPFSPIWTISGVGTAGSMLVFDSIRDLLYCPSNNGLTALNSTNGKILWSTDYSYRASSPIYTSDGLYMLINNCLHSHAALTGDLRWKTCVSVGTNFLNTPVIHPVTGSILFSVGSSLYSSNPNDGTILWSSHYSDVSNKVLMHSPIFGGNMMYILLSGTTARTTDIYELSSNGDVQWMTTLSCRSLSSLILSQGQLFIACGHHLYSWYPGYVDENWKYDFNHPVGLSTPVFRSLDNSIIVATSHSIVHCIAFNGHLQWRLQLETTSTAKHALNSPIMDSMGKIYVTNAFGKLYVISSAGELLWSRSSSEQLWIFSTPVITPNGGIILLESLNNTKSPSGSVAGAGMSQYGITLLGGKSSNS